MPNITQVNLRFAEKIILRNFSYSFPEGETTCLIGPSGCGKTTLLRVAAGLLAPDSGQVSPPAARQSFIFQEDRLLPWFGALENLTAVGIPAEVAARALAQVSLTGEEMTLPDELSGGMRRRLAIARAIAYGGDRFFLDEPLRGLDEATAAPVLAALREAIRGKTALLITHNEAEALALSDTVVQVSGPPVEVLRTAKTAAFASAAELKGWLTCDSR